MSQEGFALSEVGNEGCELTRRAIYFMLQRGSTVGSVLGGLVAATDLETTYAGSGLKCEVSVGECVVAGYNATQSGYYFRNTSAATFTPPAANASNPRIERLIARVKDASYEGAANSFALELLEGTPTSGATLTNLLGVAAAPNSSMTLAYVLVPALATVISNADIKNVGGLVGLGVQIPIANVIGLGAGLVGAWTALESLNKVEELVTPTQSVRARSELAGNTVRLRGALKIKTAATLAPAERFATMPAALRPPAEVIIPTDLNTEAGTLIIQANGEMSIGQEHGAGVKIFLDDVTYNLT